MNILVCDDEKEIVDAIEIYLKNEGYQIYKAYDGQQALEVLEQHPIQLIIMDVMMPRLDGIRATLKIRETQNIPVIMLSAKSEDTDKIMGLNIGADDYVTKPFNPLELIARVKSQLRRYTKYNPAQTAEEPAGALICRDLVLDPSSHECRLAGEPLSLTPTEFALLRILLERRGRVVSAEELFHAIWADEYYCKSSNTISVHIRHLREKMGDTADRPKYIKTVWGVGYQIER